MTAFLSRARSLHESTRDKTLILACKVIAILFRVFFYQSQGNEGIGAGQIYCISLKCSIHQTSNLTLSTIATFFTLRTHSSECHATPSLQARLIIVTAISWHLRQVRLFNKQDITMSLKTVYIPNSKNVTAVNFRITR